MKRRSIILRPFQSYLLIVIAALILTGIYFYATLNDYFLFQALRTLETRARIVSIHLEEIFQDIHDISNIDHLVELNSDAANARITIIDSMGHVLGDSYVDIARMPNMFNRPEFIMALKGGVGQDIRVSDFTKETTMFVAVPIVKNGQISGAVRAARGIKEVQAGRVEVSSKLALFGLIVLFVLTVISYIFSRQYTRPLKYMDNIARRFANGELNLRMDPPRSEEMAILAGTFNTMADNIQERVNEIVATTNNLNVVLNSMTDAVIAVDKNERIIDVNPAAAQWLGSPRENLEGGLARNVIKYGGLLGFIQEALKNNVPQDADISIFLENEHVINVKSSPIYTEDNRLNGCVIVFYDVTKIRNLDNLRRDFVSNVSHEIRTPLTVIKGSAEILQQTPALQNDPESRRFLEIINRHTERLTDLINDLLLLSRIEQNTAELKTERIYILPVIKAAVNALSTKIEDKEVKISITCSPDLRITANGGLLEQALLNLIDNAIKYSLPQNSVEIEAEIKNGCCRLSVTDHGMGVDKKHFDRLFERFYRVDEARSRKIGGTGLGLAIVKHIARAHNGNIEVQSVPHEGSTFTLVLPT